MDIQSFMNVNSDKQYGNTYLPHIFAQHISSGFKPAEWSNLTKPPLSFDDQVDCDVWSCLWQQQQMWNFLSRVIQFGSSKMLNVNMPQKERPTVTTGSASIVFVFETRDILAPPPPPPPPPPPLFVFCSTYEPVCYLVNDFAAMIVCFNSSPPTAADMSQWVGPALVQIMACRLFGAKPLSKPMLVYCQLDR